MTNSPMVLDASMPTNTGVLTLRRAICQAPSAHTPGGYGDVASAILDHDAEACPSVRQRERDVILPDETTFKAARPHTGATSRSEGGCDDGTV